METSCEKKAYFDKMAVVYITLMSRWEKNYRKRLDGMEEKNRKLKKIITAVSIVLLVIIIVIAVVFCIMKSRKYKYHVNENGTITIDKYLGHETVVPHIK